MDMQDETRSPESIEQDIEKTRGAMANTLDDLQRRFSSGHLVDQALSYFDQNSGSMGSDVMKTLREHPVPAVLTGVGIAWLVAAGWRAAEETGETSHPQGESGWWRGRSETEPSYESSVAATQEGRGFGGGQYPEYALGERAFTERRLGRDRRMDEPEYSGSEPRETAGSRMSEKAGRIGEKLTQGMERASHKVSSTTDQARRKAGEMGEQASRKAHEVGERVQRQYRYMLGEQPWVLAGLGLAVGAALGAAIPRTRQENRMMGAARDELMESARETGRQMANDTGLRGEGSGRTGPHTGSGMESAGSTPETASNRPVGAATAWTNPDSPGTGAGTRSDVRGTTIAPSSTGECDPGI